MFYCSLYHWDAQFPSSILKLCELFNPSVGALLYALPSARHTSHPSLCFSGTLYNVPLEYSHDCSLSKLKASRVLGLGFVPHIRRIQHMAESYNTLSKCLLKK